MKSLISSIILGAIFLGSVAFAGDTLVLSTFSPEGFDHTGTGTPEIFAVVKSVDGAAIDQSSIKMIINDDEVETSITAQENGLKISYTPSRQLEQEADTYVEIKCKDANGKDLETQWEFFVPMIY